ncbi:MAG: hypothetical protein JSU63_10580 [Phycisphaerales bacterium]|nr:MAG: hypothetical protein JSU63_10580 [Phycisphaerales bacterium]
MILTRRVCAPLAFGIESTCVDFAGSQDCFSVDLNDPDTLELCLCPFDVTNDSVVGLEDYLSL